MFANVAELVRAKLKEGCGVREGSRWINSNNARVQKVQMLDQVSTLVGSRAQTTVASDSSAQTTMTNNIAVVRNQQ
jgi:hypothetical protein